MPQSQAQPLAGIRVLDLSRVLAGPWATQLLGDMGADVVKVERPGIGDDTRRWGPPWFEGADGAREAAYFTCCNRGKRSIEIDFSTPAGAARIRALAARSDVLVENLKVGDLKRYGLDHSSLRALNPRLVYCSISGFGQTGAQADRPGYDFIIQAMGGLMGVTGAAEGEPMKAGVALVDIMTGLYASNGVLAALQRRERTGLGGYVDVALFDVQVATLANQAANYFATGKQPRRLGNAHPNIVPYQSFRCRNGDIAIAVGNDRQFQALCQVLGLPEVACDPAYATNASRVANREGLITLLARWFLERPVATTLDSLERAGVPAGPVNDLPTALTNPSLSDRKVITEMHHSRIGAIPGVACPIRFDHQIASGPASISWVGEHNGDLDAILSAD